jgi:phospholipid/cholesterol/gamma-HCH transport system ATP-binding protein
LSQPPIVDIDRVSFGYDVARPVLHDVTVRMPQGKVFAIMGQSGCGKTTLLRIIGGALRPTSGTARVLGMDVASLDTGELYALRRKMGMLFQFGALFTDLSVYDNVAFPLREHTDLPAESSATSSCSSWKRSDCAAPRSSSLRSCPEAWRGA